MLKKKQRLTTQAFDAAFKSGVRTHTPLFQLIYVPGDTFHGAVVVGKKVYKKAIDRNQLRRQLYSLLSLQHAQKSLCGTYIIIAKPAAKTVPVSQMCVVLEAALQKVS